MRGRAGSNSPPELGLGAPLFLRKGRQGQENGAVGEIGSADDVLNAVQQDWAGGLEQHLLVVRIEPPQRETAAAGEPAERVGEPGR
jgi:hypothetical protein